ncbi:MAG: AAA-like domain-containing protein [Leptolyngbyaceae cyanobacterium]
MPLPWLTPELPDNKLSNRQSPGADSSDLAQIANTLTLRQQQVLQAFLQGQSDEAIAQSLYVEPSTVRRHLANISKRLGLANETGERYSHRDELLELFRRERFKEAIAFPGTPLSPLSPLYVDRPPVETRCYRGIGNPGALIRIRAPRRMGKTSLLHRILACAEANGQSPVVINFHQLDGQPIADLDQLLQWFCLLISQRLKLKPQLNDYWDRERFGSIVSATAYMQGYVLAQHLEQTHQPIVLALEAVDWLFDKAAIAQGFFAMLRSWHEEAKNLEIWQQLRLIVVHSTELYIPLDIHQSPFNVGLPIQLPRFTLEQVHYLADQYGVSLGREAGRSLLDLLGGHPYLTQLALYHLTQADLDFETLSQTAATQSGIYSSDLRRIWEWVNADPALYAALQTVVQSMPSGTRLDPIQSYKLESMGLIVLEGNTARVSCHLYEQYFT